MKKLWKTPIKLFFIVAIIGLLFGCQEELNDQNMVNSTKVLIDNNLKNGEIDPCEAFVTVLLADRDIDVGTAMVQQNGEILLVTINTTGGWTISNVMIWVGDDASMIPITKSGNPKRGQFTFIEDMDPLTTSYSCEFPYDMIGESGVGVGDVAYLAISADVEFEQEDYTILEETAWAYSELYTFEGKAPGWYLEIPLNCSSAVECDLAFEANEGENWASSQNSWFSYTAEMDQEVNINSCHPNNTTVPFTYCYDTWLVVFADCEGDTSFDWYNPNANTNVIAQNDDLEFINCDYNRASSGVMLTMNEGETIKIFWPWIWASVNDDAGFFFNIEVFPLD